MASKDKIPVVEIFGPTIMGEGLFIGKPTWFVRTAVCDYQNVCLKCDSMHAVDPTQFTRTAKRMTPIGIAEELLARMEGGNCGWVTISGGNPVLWDLRDTVNALHAAGKMVCLETQGSIFRDWIILCDVIHVAPKGPGMCADANASFETLTTFMNALEDANAHADWSQPGPDIVIKIPIFCAGDLDFAEKVIEAWPMYSMTLSCGNEDPPRAGREEEVGVQYLQSSLLIRLRKIVEEVLKRPKLQHATVLPQLHTLLWGNKLGV